MGMNALRDVMPVYLEKDFLMVNRKNEKGVWRTELWTARDLNPTEPKHCPGWPPSEKKQIRERTRGHGRTSWRLVLGGDEDRRAREGQPGPGECDL